MPGITEERHAVGVIVEGDLDIHRRCGCTKLVIRQDDVLLLRNSPSAIRLRIHRARDRSTAVVVAVREAVCTFINFVPGLCCSAGVIHIEVERIANERKSSRRHYMVQRVVAEQLVQRKVRRMSRAVFKLDIRRFRTAHHCSTAFPNSVESLCRIFVRVVLEHVVVVSVQHLEERIVPSRVFGPAGKALVAIVFNIVRFPKFHRRCGSRKRERSRRGCTHRQIDFCGIFGRSKRQVVLHIDRLEFDNINRQFSVVVEIEFLAIGKRAIYGLALTIQRFVRDFVNIMVARCIDDNFQLDTSFEAGFVEHLRYRDIRLFSRVGVRLERMLDFDFVRRLRITQHLREIDFAFAALVQVNRIRQRSSHNVGIGLVGDELVDKVSIIFDSCQVLQFLLDVKRLDCT